MYIIYMQCTHMFRYVKVDICRGRESVVAMALDPGLYTWGCKP